MEKNRFLKSTVVFVLIVIIALFFTFLHKSDKKIPNLVVGIVIDQMSYDFISRYLDKYSDAGFKRLIKGGYFCRNTKITHFPSYTAPGHSSIYTGSVPSKTGITGNDWYDKSKGRIVYCTDDDTCKTVGSFSNEGNMSPSNLISPTITDQLFMSNDRKPKIIGIALKDRGAIFPAGHNANAAYWYDESSKLWITSSYYMNKIPAWVEEFNKKNLPDKYLSKPWNTLYPIESYSESTSDDNIFEEKYKGEDKPVFPHNFPELKYKNIHLLRTSPAGNSLTKDFAIETITNERLGKNGTTDFLCLSFSSTDYIGHQFGPNSIEVEDTYLRLDQDIAEILEYLDNFVGFGNYLVFLTADHGVCGNPEYLKTKGLESGTFFTKVILDSVNAYLYRGYGKSNMALYFLNQQVFLNRKLIEENGFNFDEISNNTSQYIKNNIPGVVNTFTYQELKSGNSIEFPITSFRNGYYENRCGEVFINFKKYWIEDRVRGSEHGGPYDYDVQIPLIWYGCGIKKGESSEQVEMVDITPTLSELLYISPPGDCIGKPILNAINR